MHPVTWQERGAELDPHFLPIATRFAAARTRAIPAGWLFAGGAAAMADNSSIPIAAGVVGGCCVVIGTITGIAYAGTRRRSEEFLARHVGRPSMSEQ